MYTLLIGNDVNNVNNSYSWDNLIDDLIMKYELEDDIRKENKPFPLLYEEIYLKANEKNGVKELAIKKRIAENTHKLKPNVIHDRISQLGVTNIMTTNYDYTFEKSIKPDFVKSINFGRVKEKRYSVFRSNKIKNVKVWHLQGVEDLPHTITLGYEHYSGYLQQMRNYVSTGTKGNYKNYSAQPLVKRLRNGNNLSDSWLDLFFTTDVHIVGLSLDFVEIHLWWLLNYRKRKEIEGKICIDNRIKYYYPEKYKESSSNKLDLFKVNGVQTIPLPYDTDNKETYYHRILDLIESQQK